MKGGAERKTFSNLKIARRSGKAPENLKRRSGGTAKGLPVKEASIDIPKREIPEGKEFILKVEQKFKKGRQRATEKPRLGRGWTTGVGAM